MVYMCVICLISYDYVVFIHMQGKQFEATLYKKLCGTDIIVGSPPHGLPTNIVLTGLLVAVSLIQTADSHTVLTAILHVNLG